MARHPEQGLYVCEECECNHDPECWKCGGGGYLLWESLEPDEQARIRIRWHAPDDGEPE